MPYRDFDLKLSGTGNDGYYVEAIGSPHSIRSNPVRLQLPHEEIESWRVSLRQGIANRKTTVTLGRHLFEALFPREILRIWEANRSDVDSRNALRLRLDVRSAELALVPWEIIHDGRGYIAMTRDTPLVRCSYDHRQVKATANTLPLNILLIVATPRDSPVLPNIESEVELIESGIAGLKHDRKVGRVDIIRRATRQRLQDQLAVSDYHVLHYMGHGTFENDKGYLVFENENGFAERVSGETVSYFFGDAPLRLLFLNACNTAVASDAESFLGVAHAALVAGVPAIVAMQDAVPDSVAAKFARQFYETLAMDQPLECCMVEGRKAISGEISADWSIPVLFSNADEGLLWTPRPAKWDDVDSGPYTRASPHQVVIEGDSNTVVQGNGNVVGKNISKISHVYYGPERDKKPT